METRCVCDTLMSGVVAKLILLIYRNKWPLTSICGFNIDRWFARRCDLLRYIIKYELCMPNNIRVIGDVYFWVKWPVTLTCNYDLDKWGGKMCDSLKYPCVPNMKSVGVVGEKLWQILTCQCVLCVSFFSRTPRKQLN